MAGKIEFDFLLLLQISAVFSSLRGQALSLPPGSFITHQLSSSLLLLPVLQLDATSCVRAPLQPRFPRREEHLFWWPIAVTSENCKNFGMAQIIVWPPPSTKRLDRASRRLRPCAWDNPAPLSSSLEKLKAAKNVESFFQPKPGHRRLSSLSLEHLL